MKGRLVLTAAFLGVLAFPLALATAIAVPPIIYSFEGASTASVQFQTLDARRRDLERQLATTPGSDGVQWKTQLLGGPSPEVAGQIAQVALRGALTEAGGIATGLQMTTEPADSGLTRFRVSVQATLSEAALLSFLNRVEGRSPRFALRNLDVQKVFTGSGEALSMQALFTGLYLAD